MSRIVRFIAKEPPRHAVCPAEAILQWVFATATAFAFRCGAQLVLLDELPLAFVEAADRVKPAVAQIVAEFVVAVCGDIMTMPGLPKVPAANSIDIGPDGKIVGLF